MPSDFNIFEQYAFLVFWSKILYIFYLNDILMIKRYIQCMSKNSRNGGKFSGNHTSLIPAAALLSDYLSKCSSIKKISPGVIKAGLSPLRGKRRVKLSHKSPAILLSVRDNTSQQEVYLYSDDLERTIKTLENFGAKHDFNLNVSTS